MDEIPFLEVVRGDPTPEELAALIAVLVARTSPAAAPEARGPSAWADRAHSARRPLAPRRGTAGDARPRSA
ncbi:MULTISPECIES: acyl-CoA carboxylase subunit epsilon [Streptosporangium]|uniref:Acyl-CoA carboxylase subunit epsilon n=1 Tax=Streptosporangium brasiliense TaxID=47480 RepID=A0ABT9RC20_9ACTN|nr:acyl-CoA carboxylase subunit epsilon [Streptosporangium brasiliense]MDP9866407.1 hypothetical protein [Streptosporangium brasiliense]